MEQFFSSSGLLLIIIFGGLLFSYVSHMIVVYNPPIRTRYILNFISYYLFGPFAWGVLWFIESGNTNRFEFLSLTFWSFFLFMMIGTIGGVMLERRNRRKGQ